MRKIILTAAITSVLCVSAVAQQATIKVDTSRVIGDIDRNIYGVFMEPIRTTMDGLLDTEIVSDSGDFAGMAEVSVINADDVNAAYTPENPDRYMPETSSARASGRSFRYAFAPHSFTQIKVRVE